MFIGAKVIVDPPTYNRNGVVFKTGEQPPEREGTIFHVASDYITVLYDTGRLESTPIARCRLVPSSSIGTDPHGADTQALTDVIAELRARLDESEAELAEYTRTADRKRTAIVGLARVAWRATAVDQFGTLPISMTISDLDFVLRALGKADGYVDHTNTVDWLGANAPHARYATRALSEIRRDAQDFDAATSDPVLGTQSPELADALVAFTRSFVKLTGFASPVLEIVLHPEVALRLGLKPGERRGWMRTTLTSREG